MSGSKDEIIQHFLEVTKVLKAENETLKKDLALTRQQRDDLIVQLETAVQCQDLDHCKMTQNKIILEYVHACMAKMSKHVEQAIYPSSRKRAASPLLSPSPSSKRHAGNVVASGSAHHAFQAGVFK